MYLTFWLICADKHWCRSQLVRIINSTINTRLNCRLALEWNQGYVSVQLTEIGQKWCHRLTEIMAAFFKLWRTRVWNIWQSFSARLKSLSAFISFFWPAWSHRGRVKRRPNFYSSTKHAHVHGTTHAHNHKTSKTEVYAHDLTISDIFCEAKSFPARGIKFWGNIESFDFFKNFSLT